MSESALHELFPGVAEPVPLRIDEGGVVRVGNSRVSLDIVVEQYDNGMTPEDMVRAYDALDPADVHSAIAYYLRHPKEVRAYLTQRSSEAASLQTKVEGERPGVSRSELKRRSTGAGVDASTRQ
jgi:uncharacterized protein (DUF433 family)